MPVTNSDRASDEDHRLHKPGVAGSSPAAASPVQICHTDAAQYHLWPEVSASQIKELHRSPVAFYDRCIAKSAPPKTGAALEYGTLLHLWAELGEDEFWKLARPYPADKLTATGLVGKDAKQWAADQPPGSVLITPSDHAQLWAQTRQILENSAARRLLETSDDREFNVRFRWDGVACRSRIDGSSSLGRWYDLKTTRERDPFGRAWSAVDGFDYDIQAAFYEEAATQCGVLDPRLRFIFTSTVAPHHCAVLYLPEEVRLRGRRRCLRLLSEYRTRMEWGQWLPQYYGEEHEMPCPRFMKEGD